METKKIKIKVLPIEELKQWLGPKNTEEVKKLTAKDIMDGYIHNDVVWMEDPEEPLGVYILDYYTKEVFYLDMNNAFKQIIEGGK